MHTANGNDAMTPGNTGRFAPYLQAIHMYFRQAAAVLAFCGFSAAMAAPVAFEFTANVTSLFNYATGQNDYVPGQVVFGTYTIDVANAETSS